MDNEDEVNSDEDDDSFIESFFINYFNCQQMNTTDLESKQIPVISDIERIKKVVEIIEFVGEKVGELIDKIEVPPPQGSTDYYDTRKSIENEHGEEVETQTE